MKNISKLSEKVARKVAKIYSLRNENISVAKIAKKVGLSESGVRWHLRKY